MEKNNLKSRKRMNYILHRNKQNKNSRNFVSENEGQETTKWHKVLKYKKNTCRHGILYFEHFMQLNLTWKDKGGCRCILWWGLSSNLKWESLPSGCWVKEGDYSFLWKILWHFMFYLHNYWINFMCNIV